MTRREKLLAAAVGLLGLFFVGLWGLARIQSAFATRSDQIAALEEDIREKEFEKVRGSRAADRLAVYESRALPGNREQARSMYQSWLLETAEDVSFEDIKVDPIAGRPVGDAYFLHRFNVSGRGNLEQIVDFLYQFYSKDILHRIDSLSISPIKDTRMLDVVVAIEAASLPASTNVDQLPVEPSRRLAFDTLEEYTDPILRRNIFGPPNNSPKFEGVSSKEFVVSKTHSLRVRARDADRKDRLRYWLEADEELAATIDESSGEIKFNPSKLGEFAMKVGVSDDGLPAGNDEVSFTVSIVEPEPVAEPVATETKPSFDPASQAFITAVVEVNGKPEMWVSVRTTGELLKLHEGDHIKIGQFEGIVRKIHPKAIAIDSGEKRVYVRQGQTLTQAAELVVDDI